MASNIEKIETVVVETKLGKICGLIQKSETKSFEDTEYYSFQGIPYAKPPLGPLRFRAPQPPEPWSGIYEATQEGSPCAQKSFDGEIIGDENCLFLNVYTPTKPGISCGELLPVMFWIHGGGFLTGSGTQNLYSPDYLMPLKNVVLVTINYRLGLFGFLKCDDPKIGIPGNAGCKDIIMALKWVQSHIDKFNGDPNNVTIWGQSAGANTVHSLLLSPMATGLFHKAILHSGIYFRRFLPGKKQTLWIMNILSAAGYTTENEMEAINLLSTFTTEDVVRTLTNYRESMGTTVTSFPSITIESTSSLEEAYMIEDYESCYLENRVNAVPIMIGTNLDDGMVFTSKKDSYGAPTPELVGPNTVVPELINIPDEAKYEEIGKKIMNFYYGKETPSRRNLDKYSRLLSDIVYNLGTRHLIQLYQMATTQPIYRYRFTLDSSYNLYKKFYNIQVPCVYHGDELTYLFHTKYSRVFRPRSVEELTLYRMTRLWTNFAKTGNPNNPVDNSLSNINWLPVQHDALNHLNIGKSLRYMKSQDRQEEVRFKFWDDLLGSYYKSLQIETIGDKNNYEYIENIRFQVKFTKQYLD